MRRRFSLLALLLALAPLGGSARAEEPPSVVVSIKPIHSLVAAVMAGVGKPDLIVKGAASPHGYTVTPADAQSLARARLVFWIGPIFESFLVKPLAVLGGKVEIVQLAEAPGITLLPVRSSGAWQLDESDPHPGTGDPSTDGHLWLDPRNARAMVAFIAARLSVIDPDHVGRYTANAAQLYRRLDALDATLREKLAPIGAKPFIVFHPAFQYLERRYRIAAAGSITLTPDQPPGPHRLEAARHRLRLAGARCVFAEPGAQPALIQTVVEGAHARIGTLDPEGLSLEPGPALYFDLINGIATSLTECLRRPD